MAVGPHTSVSKRVPDQMRRDSQQDGEDYGGKPGWAREPEFLEIRNKAQSNRGGQSCRERHLHETMKEPENDQGERESQKKGTRQCVSEAASWSKREEVLKVGCKSSDNQCRWNEPRSLKWERSGGVCGGKGHNCILSQREVLNSRW